MKKIFTIVIMSVIVGILLFILTGCTTYNNMDTDNGLSASKLVELKSKIEQDETSYGDNYLKLADSQISNVYMREPDRIYFKKPDKEGFYLFEKSDGNYKHLLEVSEDRMSYSIMQDFNLWCFTPDSIDTMMKSGDIYIIFDYDNENSSEYGTGTDLIYDPNFQRDLIFRFFEDSRLYRLASYLSYDKKLMSKEELGKEEFAVDTSISGYQYMMCNSSNYYND